MVNGELKQAPICVAGRVSIRPGEAVEFFDFEDGTAPDPDSERLRDTVGVALCAYLQAMLARSSKCTPDERALLPPYMTATLDALVLRCSDGVFVRYDPTHEPSGIVRCACTQQPLQDIAPILSDQVVHFAADPDSFRPSTPGPGITFNVKEHGVRREVATVTPYVVAPLTASQTIHTRSAPRRPPRILTVRSDFDVRALGAVAPRPEGSGLPMQGAQNFVSALRAHLPVPWIAIEVYPIHPDEWWDAAAAPLWAELAVLAMLASASSNDRALNALDSRDELRKGYIALLDRFEQLLSGKEEPVHQFLKANPMLLCPTFVRYWSKLPIGSWVTDFVFREPHDDYLLVELEAPTKKLFRKNGQQREELTRPINQIVDCIQHIGEHKAEVEAAGLTNISSSPRGLVVIGRSSHLTPENRKKLAAIEARHHRLRIQTYDDLLMACRSQLESVVGPLSIKSDIAKLYFFGEKAS